MSDASSALVTILATMVREALAHEQGEKESHAQTQET
jgi:hypothetical protein